MRCITPQITWHNREPVLSIDLDPTSDSSQGFYRLVTGGADSHLLVWHLREQDTLKPDLLCVADLTRHQKAINVVRFSPDGNLIASADDDSHVYIWRNEGKTKAEEIWLVDKIFRRHFEDVSDLSWSSDCAFIVTASVDNSAIIWDVKKNAALYTWSEHNGLVQGVNFDPRGEYIATMCTDRTMRMFNTKTGKLAAKVFKYPDSWLSDVNDGTTQVKSPTTTTTGKENGGKGGTDIPIQKSSGSIIASNRLFHDDTLRTFCRRLSFSPHGELLMVPGGIIPPQTSRKENSTQQGQGTTDYALGTSSDMDNKTKKARKSIGDKEITVSNNGVIVFCRNSFTNPCAVIPTGSSYSIAVRFCPMYFRREEEAFTYDSDFLNPSKKSERKIACIGKLRPRKRERRPIMDMPYKLVYAIATNNSVIIGDTESSQPIAVIRNIHCTRMSDLTWSSDGRVLLVSSTDGYCSIISFAEKELGSAIENVEEATATCFPIMSDVKKKEVMTPKKKEKYLNGNKKTKEPSTNKKDKEPKVSKKGEIQIQTVFKKMEKQRKSNEKESSISEESANNIPTSLPNTEISSDDLLEEKQIDTILKPKGTPQRNTLDRWIIKTPKTGEKDAPNEKEKSQIKLRQSITPSKTNKPKSKLLGFGPDKYIPLVKLPRANIDIQSSSILSLPSTADMKITSAEIASLEHAPIIIDLELETDSNPQDSEAVEKDSKPGEKRPATSPLSSHQNKQPRRIQLITLATSLDVKKAETD